MTRARTAHTILRSTCADALEGADGVAERVRRLKEEIRLYVHYRVAKALARKSADAAGAYTAELNAAATWREIERLLKLVRAAGARGPGVGGRPSKR